MGDVRADSRLSCPSDTFVPLRKINTRIWVIQTLTDFLSSGDREGILAFEIEGDREGGRQIWK